MGLITHAHKGRGLETVVIHSQRHVLRLEQIQQAAKKIRDPADSRRWVTIPVKGPCDFVGEFRVDPWKGRAVWFDAKTCADPHRFPLAEWARKRPNQKFCLLHHGEAGAVAGLLVEATKWKGGRFLWLGWEFIDVLPTTPSLRFDDRAWVDLGDSLHLIKFENLLPGGGASEAVKDAQAIRAYQNAIQGGKPARRPE